MGESIKVEIEGFREFRKALRETDRGLLKSLRLALNESADLVVDNTKVKRGSTGKAAGSVKAQSTQTKSRVTGGGSKAPHYPWLDFGGKVGKYRQVVRAYKKEGRYIYPAYRKLRDSGRFQEVLTKALQKVARSAGLDVKDD